ncbi:MAG: LysR family transcriptional regulator [Firmicutes bacterium]|nr:LysR family transcriptional regulator [Bacillota bacterium]
MTFQQLLYVVEISKCGSLNKAAQKLFISQTGISTAVRALENELGVRFFERSNRGVEFTPEGKEFVGYASSLLSQKQQIESMYKGGQSYESAESFSVSTQRFIFIQDAFIRLLKNSAGNFNFTYKEVNMEMVIEDVECHRADVGVISLSDFSEKIINHILELKNLQFNEVISVLPRVFCRKGHPLTALDEVSEEDLVNYPYISYERGLGVAIEFSEEYHLFSLLKPSKSITTNNRATAEDLFSQTDAVTIGSGLLAKSLTHSFTSVPLKNVTPLRIGYIVSNSGKNSSKTSEFIEFFRQSAKDSICFTKECTL